MTILREQGLTGDVPFPGLAQKGLPDVSFHSCSPFLLTGVFTPTEPPEATHRKQTSLSHSVSQRELPHQP